MMGELCGGTELVPTTICIVQLAYAPAGMAGKRTWGYDPTWRPIQDEGCVTLRLEGAKDDEDVPRLAAASQASLFFR